MDTLNRSLAEQLFSPLRITFSPPRPDGSFVLSLIDETDTAVYRRVLTAQQRQDTEAFNQCLEDIHMDLAVRAGNIPTELHKILREQDSVLNYHVA